ncbi:MAG: hypothetical protein LBN71_06470 [Tannerella sp.]|nr:hypothetical protein [Tannerella sp.]
MENQSDSILLIAVGCGAINCANSIIRMEEERKAESVMNKIAVYHDKCIKATFVGNRILILRVNGDYEVKTLLEPYVRNVNVAIVLATLGGITGSFVTPKIGKFLHEKGITVLSVVTTPFHFEGEKRTLRAIKCIEEISEYSSTLIRFNFDTMSEDPDVSASDAFRRMDKKLIETVFSIHEAYKRHSCKEIL